MMEICNIRFLIILGCSVLSVPVWSQKTSESIECKACLNDVEFFSSESKTFTVSKKIYRLYSNSQHTPGFAITFYLETKQSVQYELVDVAGRSVESRTLYDVLDQTFHFQANNVQAGIYIVRIKMNNRYFAERVYLGQASL